MQSKHHTHTPSLAVLAALAMAFSLSASAAAATKYVRFEQLTCISPNSSGGDDVYLEIIVDTQLSRLPASGARMMRSSDSTSTWDVGFHAEADAIVQVMLRKRLGGVPRDDKVIGILPMPVFGLKNGRKVTRFNELGATYDLAYTVSDTPLPEKPDDSAYAGQLSTISSLFDVRRDTVIGGGFRAISKTLGNVNVLLCAENCLGDSTCVAFQYERERQICLLKTEKIGSLGVNTARGVDYFEHRTRKTAPPTNTYEQQLAMTGELFDIRRDTVIEGGFRAVSKTLGNVNVLLCAQNCLSDSTCVAFQYERERQICLLKTEKIGSLGVSAAEGVDYFEHRTRTATASSYDGKIAGISSLFSVKRGTGMTGGSATAIRSTTGTPVDACADQCAKEVRCRAFHFYPEDNQCVLQSASISETGAFNNPRVDYLEHRRRNGDYEQLVTIASESFAVSRGGLPYSAASASYSTIQGLNLAGCAETCKYDNRCQAFGYQSSAKTCVLMSKKMGQNGIQQIPGNDYFERR